MAIAVALFIVLFAQDPPAPAGRAKRVSPPQPQQQQGAEYFVGSWTFTWIGRESPVSPGPRAGTLTYARNGALLDLRLDGNVEDGGPYTETGTAEWNAGTKTMTFVERLGKGIVLRFVGDWSSPIGIRAESEPVKAGSQTIRVRRLYQILSPQSYMVTEDISLNGGPYQRLGNGRFQKVQR